jgi:hypothetical protein
MKNKTRKPKTTEKQMYQETATIQDDGELRFNNKSDFTTKYQKYYVYI